MQAIESTDVLATDGRDLENVLVVDWEVATVHGVAVLSIPRLAISGGDEERTFTLTRNEDGSYGLVSEGLPLIRLEPGFTKAAADMIGGEGIHDRVVHEFDRIEAILDLSEGRMNRLAIDITI